MPLQFKNQDCTPRPAVVIEILDDVVRLDANRPLAGKTLVFGIDIVDPGLEPESSHFTFGCDSCGESRDD